jgi:hypothetical protein
MKYKNHPRKELKPNPAYTKLQSGISRHSEVILKSFLVITIFTGKKSFCQQ